MTNLPEMSNSGHHSAITGFTLTDWDYGVALSMADAICRVLGIDANNVISLSLSVALIEAELYALNDAGKPYTERLVDGVWQPNYGQPVPGADERIATHTLTYTRSAV